MCAALEKKTSPCAERHVSSTNGGCGHGTMTIGTWCNDDNINICGEMECGGWRQRREGGGKDGGAVLSLGRGGGGEEVVWVEWSGVEWSGVEVVVVVEVVVRTLCTWNVSVDKP